jgi:NAD(P)-dependent dehydrogenase (short-subunit alcohol dehydrogenase family)
MKTFLSIGAGPGMGMATAERFAREGFQVILSARNQTQTQRLAEQLNAQGHKAETRAVDASDPSSVASLVESVERELGGIDVLHYNAASLRAATLADQPRDSFNSDLAVNIGGAMAAAQAAAPRMAARGSGSILLTGGGLALHPHPDYLSLSIGKAGIRALALALFDSFKAKGIHVATVTVSSSVSPGSQDALAVAQQFWTLHSQPAGTWETEVVYPPHA